MNFPDFLNSIKAFRISSMLAMPDGILEISRKIPEICSSAAALPMLSRMSFNPIYFTPDIEPKLKLAKGLSLLRSFIDSSKVKMSTELFSRETSLSPEAAPTIAARRMKMKKKVSTKPNMDANTILKKDFMGEN